MTTGVGLANILIIGFIVLALIIGLLWAIRRKSCPVCSRFIKKHALTCYHCGNSVKSSSRR